MCGIAIYAWMLHPFELLQEIMLLNDAIPIAIAAWRAKLLLLWQSGEKMLKINIGEI